MSRAGRKRGVIILLTRPRKCRKQDGALLSKLLQTVVNDLRRLDGFKLRPQVTQQNVMQRPLEQADPMIGIDQREEALNKLVVLTRAQRSQRWERHIDQWQ